MVHLKAVKNDEKCFLFHFKFLSNEHMTQEVFHLYLSYYLQSKSGTSQQYDIISQ